MFFNEAQKVIWFTQDKDGHQVLHRPDGTKVKGKEKCLPSDQMLCYRERAHLFMQECGIWDGTSFACTVQTLFFLKPTSHKTYLFCGLDGAERFIYSMLQDDIVKASRLAHASGLHVTEVMSHKNINNTWAEVGRKLTGSELEGL